MAAVAVAHVATVAYEPGRYSWRPTCSCGWQAVWGYANEHAARIMADHHAVYGTTS